MSRRGWVRFWAWAIALTLAIALSGKVQGACRQEEPNETWNPTGWVGCVQYGVGWATRWDGDGIARNDCVYPWDDCPPIRITSLTTGRSVVVTPTMYCNCWVGTDEPVLVDLDRAAVDQLGLEWAAGKYKVRVRPVGQGGLPDTSIPRGILTTR